MKKGKVIEQGTHESLLEDEDGAYWALVNAQKLTMGDNFADQSDLIETAKTDALVRTMTSASGAAAPTDGTTAWQPKGLLGSFGRLLYEQSVQWPLYVCLAAGCVGAASAYPIQAWLFAKLITVATPPFDNVASTSSHWALMFFILALGAGVAYFVLGSSSNAISVVSKFQFLLTVGIYLTCW